VAQLFTLGELARMTKQLSTVERSFDLVKPSGEKTRFTVSYGPVYQRDQLFFCPVRFAGWANPPPDIQGDDSLDALLQAVRLVHAILRDFREHGGRVLYAGIDADYLLESIVTDEPTFA
jgi:hypothetical protein